MNVLVGGLVRNRHGQLGPYLRHLQRMTAPRGVRLATLFVLDNCERGTAEMILERLPASLFVMVEDGGPAYDRERGHKHFDRMARLRNLLRAEARAGFDALLSIDSDILATPDLLAQLLASGKPWVAAVVDNTRGRRMAFNVMHERPHHPGHYERRALDFVAGGPADMVGAVCLYRRELLDAAEYQDDPRGEDVGFARSAAEARVGGWYIPLELEHLMTDGQLRAHLERCPLCVAGGPEHVTAGGPTITEEGASHGIHEPGTRPGADLVRPARR